MAASSTTSQHAGQAQIRTLVSSTVQLVPVTAASGEAVCCLDILTALCSLLVDRLYDKIQIVVSPHAPHFYGDDRSKFEYASLSRKYHFGGEISASAKDTHSIAAAANGRM